VSRLAQLRRQPSAVLLVVQLLGVLIYPVFGDSQAGIGAVSIFGLAVLAVAIWSVETTAWTVWVSIVLGLPSGVFAIAQIVSSDRVWQGWGSGFEAAFYFYAAGSLIAYMLSDFTITRDELFAVGSTFTLLAWAFAHLYVVTQIIWPHSFTAAVNASQPRSWVELLFLSFTTLSSTGLSDVVPIEAHARSFVMIEQLAGLAYVAMIVSWMVGLTVTRARINGSADVRADQVSDAVGDREGNRTEQ
jgi:hypothetical protein